MSREGKIEIISKDIYKLIEESDYEKAELLLENTIRIYDRSYNALILLALIKYRKKNFKECRGLLERSIELSNSNRASQYLDKLYNEKSLYNNYCTFYDHYCKGQYRSCIEILEEIRNDKENTKEISYILGRLYLKRGRFIKAFVNLINGKLF